MWGVGCFLNQRRQNGTVHEMWKGVGTRQDFHGEHAAHCEEYALRWRPPQLVDEVETLYILSKY